MRRAILGFVAVNLVLAGLLTVVVAEPPKKLFSLSVPAKPAETTPAVKAIKTDVEALNDWWRNKYGDGGPTLAVINLGSHQPLKNVEIKYDSGHPAGPYWMPLTEYLDRFRDPKADPDSILYPLRGGSKGATAFVATIAPANARTASVKRLFVIANSQVIYDTDKFKILP